MKMRLFLFLFLGLVNDTFAQKNVFKLYTDSVLLRNDSDLIIADFESRVKKVDSQVSFNGLKTIVKDNLFSGNYLERTNRIYLPHWPTAPKPIKDFCTQVMGGKKEGEQLAAMYFYGFFLPHEVGHGLQFNAHVRKDNEYDNEYDANVMALLYWRAKGKDKEMAECYRIAKIVLSKLKNPIPENADEKKYFTEHYEEMAQNADQYAYMLFKQIVIIFEDKNLPDFNTYIGQYLAKKPGN